VKQKREDAGFALLERVRAEIYFAPARVPRSESAVGWAKGLAALKHSTIDAASALHCAPVAVSEE